MRTKRLKIRTRISARVPTSGNRGHKVLQVPVHNKHTYLLVSPSLNLFSTQYRKLRNTPSNNIWYVKVKVKVKQSRYRPRVVQRVPGIKVARFHNNGTGWWYGCQTYAPPAFTPRKYTWYSFLLEAESTPGP
jgi:hypothetical protein